MSNTLSIVKFEWDKNRSFKDGNPYSIFFIYPQKGKPFIVKGGLNDVETYLKRVTTPYLCYRSHWRHGNHRGLWTVVNTTTHIHFRHIAKNECIKNGNRAWEIKVFFDKKDLRSTTQIKTIKRLRKIPRKWIKELDEYV